MQKLEKIKFENKDELNMLLNGDQDFIFFDEDDFADMEKKLNKLYKHIKTKVERNGGDANYDCCETIIQRKSDKKYFKGEFTYDNISGLRAYEHYFEEIPEGALSYYVKIRKPSAPKKKKSIIQEIHKLQNSLETKDIQRWEILEKCMRDLLTLEPRD